MKYKRQNLGPAGGPRRDQTPRWRWHFNRIHKMPKRRAK